MTILSTQLDIGEMYTRGDLSGLLGYQKYPSQAIGVGVFSPPMVQSILIFSTIFNGKSWVNYKMDDQHFVYTADPKQLLTGKELLLFIRKDQDSSFYYFGRCKYTREIQVKSYYYKVCVLELLDTTFSKAIQKLTTKQREVLAEIAIS